MHILITGGAGFIGSHLADALLQDGHAVRALDNLDPQVHGPARDRPPYLDARVDLMVGDVCDPQIVSRALDGIDAVYHFAARVGVGQSMYQPVDYARTNNIGTATLLEAIATRRLQRLIVASSMSIYGEGRARDSAGHVVDPPERPTGQLRSGQWEPVGSDGEPLEPIPTDEGKPPCLSSMYALNKYDQERACLIFGQAYGIPTVALRFFNVYGPRQALSNPYTGVLAIFACRLLNGKPPMLFEDGRQRRDFVSVYDVARACTSALTAPGAPGRSFNIGSGESFTVTHIAERLAEALERPDLRPTVTRTYRAGDIRHCFADISAAREVLDYRPRVSLGEGLAELCGWVREQTAQDSVEQAATELSSRGLTV